MTYDEFEAILQGRGISVGYRDPRDQVTRLDTPLPVKIDPTTPDPYPFEFDAVYLVQWFYPPDGTCPSTFLLGKDLREQKWYPMEHFMPA